MKSKHLNPWTILKTREIYKNPWIRLSESDVLNPAGKKSIYGVVNFQNIAVGAMAIDEDDRILLVGQYRFALERYSWEIPEGGCPLGTSVIATARRELREETGYRARRWSKLLTMHLSNSVTDERAEIFLAEELTPGESAPEETERLEVKWMPLRDAVALVEKGEITDAISVAAILQVARLRGVGIGARSGSARKKSLNPRGAKKKSDGTNRKSREGR